MSEVRVDASLMVKWFVPENYESQADAFAGDCESLGVIRIAPEFILAEATNAIRKKVGRDELGPVEGLKAAAQMSRMGIEKYDCRDLWPADERFFNAMRNHPRVKHIRDYKPGMLGV